MTKAETVKLFAVIAASYPRDTAFAAADAQMVGVWAKMLADVPHEIAESAVAAHVTTSQFPPSIAEIRQWAVKASMPASMDADQAWGLVLAAIRSNGYYDPQGAKAAMPPEVWETAMRIYPAWEQLCMSENGIADRAHFMRMWEARAKREREIAVLPEAMRTAISEPTQKALPGGNQKCLLQ